MKCVFLIADIGDKSANRGSTSSSQVNLKVNIGRDAAFECGSAKTPDPGPRSIHELQPGDIDIIAALGDSVTAGVGIDSTSLFNLIPGNRGKSWSIGGDGNLDGTSGHERVVTLPNIIKMFRNGEKLHGYSTSGGSSYWRSSNKNLNQAVPSTTADEKFQQKKSN